MKMRILVPTGNYVNFKKSELQLEEDFRTGDCMFIETNSGHKFFKIRQMDGYHIYAEELRVIKTIGGEDDESI